MEGTENKNNIEEMEEAFANFFHEQVRRHPGWFNITYTVNLDNCANVHIYQSGTPSDPLPPDPPGGGGNQ